MKVKSPPELPLHTNMDLDPALMCNLFLKLSDDQAIIGGMVQPI
jgi:hypothetical protein